MYYHASNVPDIKVLEPQISNHNVPLIYFSKKRENVLVYLSNAVEKYCRESGFHYNGKWHKWASYGFDADGKLVFDEYYPDALEDTYKGVSGYIYYADNIYENKMNISISNAVVTSVPVCVNYYEFIADAYEEILKAERDGLIKIRRYEDLNNDMLCWIEKTIRQEYLMADYSPDYQHFLKAKFSFLNYDKTKKVD